MGDPILIKVFPFTCVAPCPHLQKEVQSGFYPVLISLCVLALEVTYFFLLVFLLCAIIPCKYFLMILMWTTLKADNFDYLEKAFNIPF